jgi:hypothetical protein
MKCKLHGNCWNYHQQYEKWVYFEIMSQQFLLKPHNLKSKRLNLEELT